MRIHKDHVGFSGDKFPYDGIEETGLTASGTTGNQRVHLKCFRGNAECLSLRTYTDGYTIFRPFPAFTERRIVSKQSYRSVPFFDRDIGYRTAFAHIAASGPEKLVIGYVFQASGHPSRCP